MSSNVRVLSEGLQNAYDSTKASSPILQHVTLFAQYMFYVTYPLNTLFWHATYKNKRRQLWFSKFPSKLLSIQLAAKSRSWLTFPTARPKLAAILALGSFLISIYLGSKVEQVMKNIKCVCVWRQGYNYFHIALSLGSDVECRKPQLKLYEERERNERGVFSCFFWK